MEGQPVIFDKFKSIDTLIFDVDGVWTNGDLLITEDGGFLRTMNTKDGYAGQKAVKAGFNLIVITGGFSKGVEERLRKLGMTEVHIGIQNKMELFQQMISEGRVNPETSLYVGDDLPDYDIMKAVYLSCCPADAVPELLAECEYVSPYDGGKGCVRDIIERVMRSQEKW